MTTAFRFLYQPANAPPCSMWLYLCASLNTPAGAARLVADWNKRDRGKTRWRCDPVDPRDVDHPLRERG